MRTSTLFLVILLGIILTVCYGCKTPTATVTGKVVNSYLPDKPAIEGVEVSIIGKPELKTSTDSSGNFSIEVPAKKNSSLTFSFSKSDYHIPDVMVAIDASGQPQMTGDINGAIIVTSPTAASYVASTIPYKGINPRFICKSPDEKYLYFSEAGSREKQYIMRWTVGTDECIILAGGGDGRKDPAESYAGDKAQFYRPEGIDISSDGDTIYVADPQNGYGRIRKITGVKEAKSASDVMVCTIAGGSGMKFKRGTDVSGLKAELGHITGIELADNDNTLYICDVHSIVWKLSNVKEAKTGEDTLASYFAGTWFSKMTLKDNPLKDGTLKEALFIEPSDIEITADEDIMYVSDANLVRKITGLKSGNPTVSTIAGEYSKAGNNNSLEKINCLILSKDEDTLFISDSKQHKIKKVQNVKTASSLKDTKITEVSGIMDKPTKGQGEELVFRGAAGMILNKDNTILYATDIRNNVRQVVASEDKK